MIDSDNIDNLAIKQKHVLQVLRNFQDGYKKRDISNIDGFMDLFLQSDEVELIGIGASTRGGNEWFLGVEAVKSIIEGDWEYWGDVILDVEGAKISLLGDVAWLSTTGSIKQTETHDKALPLYLEQMKDILVDEENDDDTKLLEATHFGMRRLRERLKGMGHQWPFVFTAVLIFSQNTWLFHTIHWSMPVD